MTLTTMLLSIGIVALILTLITGYFFKTVKNWGVSYLQNFTGALFIFSGWVKAIDPLGTAYKMEQYFAEFEATFSGTWFSFLAPLFPWLSDMSSGFSVFMIVFEIALGIMLIIGAAPKFTKWAFFLLVLFFTFLTGFTYLTGYVPNEVNFFSFSQWVAFEESNMKVTDCGCFGDFIKLKPKTSFFKDVFLLIPAILFLFAGKQMHQWFNSITRTAIVALSIVGLLIYCFSNYIWDLPHTDFRPFKEETNVSERKALEEEALNNVEITSYKITNKESGEVIEVPYDQYIGGEYKKYPESEFDLIQLKTEPEIAQTKISEFEIQDIEGYDITEDILSAEGYSFMIVSIKIPHTSTSISQTVYDTTYVVDTIRIDGSDSTSLVKKVDQVSPRQIQVENYEFDEKYSKRYTEVVNPMLSAAEAAGIKAYAVTSFADPTMIEDFRNATQSAYPWHLGDDILLKTIIRSNPGVVLWKDGQIVKKWHHSKLPSFEEIKEKYIQ